MAQDKEEHLELMDDVVIDLLNAKWNTFIKFRYAANNSKWMEQLYKQIVKQINVYECVIEFVMIALAGFTGNSFYFASTSSYPSSAS